MRAHPQLRVAFVRLDTEGRVTRSLILGDSRLSARLSPRILLDTERSGLRVNVRAPVGTSGSHASHLQSSGSMLTRSAKWDPLSRAVAKVWRQGICARLRLRRGVGRFEDIRKLRLRRCYKLLGLAASPSLEVGDCVG
eukprot:scaffold4248_cov231-Pinguiococcus_pyrenoidosus.AAC.1